MMCTESTPCAHTSKYDVQMVSDNWIIDEVFKKNKNMTNKQQQSKIRSAYFSTQLLYLNVTQYEDDRGE